MCFRASPGARGCATRPQRRPRARVVVCGASRRMGEEGAAREPLLGGEERARAIGAGDGDGGGGGVTVAARGHSLRARGAAQRHRGRRRQTRPRWSRPRALNGACVRGGAAPAGPRARCGPARGQTRAPPCACGWDGSCAPIAARERARRGRGRKRRAVRSPNALICARVLTHREGDGQTAGTSTARTPSAALASACAARCERRIGALGMRGERRLSRSDSFRAGRRSSSETRRADARFAHRARPRVPRRPPPPPPAHAPTLSSSPNARVDDESRTRSAARPF